MIKKIKRKLIKWLMKDDIFYVCDDDANWYDTQEEALQGLVDRLGQRMNGQFTSVERLALINIQDYELSVNEDLSWTATEI